MLTPALLFAMLLSSITSTVRNVLEIVLVWNKLGIQLPDLNLKERAAQFGSFFTKDKAAQNGQPAANTTAAEAE